MLKFEGECVPRGRRWRGWRGGRWLARRGSWSCTASLFVRSAWLQIEMCVIDHHCRKIGMIMNHDPFNKIGWHVQYDSGMGVVMAPQMSSNERCILDTFLSSMLTTLSRNLPFAFKFIIYNLFLTCYLHTWLYHITVTCCHVVRNACSISNGIALRTCTTC